MSARKTCPLCAAPALLAVVRAARAYAKRHCDFSEPVSCPDCEGFRKALTALDAGKEG